MRECLEALEGEMDCVNRPLGFGGCYHDGANARQTGSPSTGFPFFGVDALEGSRESS